MHDASLAPSHYRKVFHQSRDPLYQYIYYWTVQLHSIGIIRHPHLQAQSTSRVQISTRTYNKQCYRPGYKSGNLHLDPARVWRAMLKAQRSMFDAASNVDCGA